MQPHVAVPLLLLVGDIGHVFQPADEWVRQALPVGDRHHLAEAGLPSNRIAAIEVQEQPQEPERERSTVVITRGSYHLERLLVKALRALVIVLVLDGQDALHPENASEHIAVTGR